MDGMTIGVGGKTLLFATTGDVAEVASGGGTTVTGRWVSSSPARDNKIRYKIGAADQPPLQAIYAFNATNQLVMTLQAGGASSNACVVAGRIKVDRDHNIAYCLVDQNGKDTGVEITVYVTGFGIAEGTNNLALTFAGGSTTHITGESGVQSLEAERNHLEKFQADDLLTFSAVTRNTINGVSVPIPANLEFFGAWDIQDGNIVFVSKIEGDLAHPGVHIGFAGRFKAVTLGFVYFADGNATEVALNIRGQHVFRSDAADTDLTWNTSIGFSNKTFRAKVDVDLHRTTARGGVLDLGGSLTVQENAGKQTTVDLALKATYRFSADNMLVFNAVVTEGDRPSYDLMLAGTFVYSNMKLTFKIEYTNVAGAAALHAEVGLQGSKTSMVRNVALLLDITEQEAKLRLNLQFEVRMRFANGVRVKEKPPLPAVA